MAHASLRTTIATKRRLLELAPDSNGVEIEVKPMNFERKCVDSLEAVYNLDCSAQMEQALLLLADLVPEGRREGFGADVWDMRDDLRSREANPIEFVERLREWIADAITDEYLDNHTSASV